jgi:hypothetical protein
MNIARIIVENLGVETANKLLHDIYMQGSEYFTGQLRQVIVEEELRQTCPAFMASPTSISGWRVQ